eukprot:11224081-Lingulodinium_polyedra.AAC.1
MQQPPKRRPSVIGVTAVCGKFTAQYLDVRLVLSETPFGRLGAGVCWTPARRDLIMHLPTVSGEA